MRERSGFEKLNTARGTSLAVFAAVFLLLLYCNLHTALVADDFRYCFSFADGKRMTCLSQLLPSMAAHRHSMNGRVIAHALVQLFLMLPKPVFNAVNALFFAALVRLICRPALGRGEHNAVLAAAVFGCLWVLQPEFGQVFLWLDGSVNYLWCAVFCLLWLLPWAESFLTGKEPSRTAQILLVLASPLVGAYSENSSVALIFLSLVFLALRLFFDKKRISLWMILAPALALAGFFFMMLAPATAANKAAEMKLPVLLGNFVETGAFYLRFWPLLVSFALLFFLSVKNGTDLRRRMLAVVYLLGSLAGHFVLTFALYCAGRSTYIGLALLLAANALLFPPLLKTGEKKLLLALCALCMVFTVWKVYAGVTDILHTDYLLDFNRELIEEAAANGETDLQVPRPYARTKYSALEGLPYLNTEDPTDWPNVYMAKYYGVNSIIGY